MDASEWEAMKKVEKLLEEAVAREKELSADVERLQQEKISALEANEKMVTIKKVVSSSETIQCKTDPRLVMEKFFGMVANNINYAIERKGRHSHLSSRDVETAWQNSRGMQYMNHEFEAIQDLFFTTKHEMRDLEDRSETIHKGLDQVKADIAKEYEESMSKEHKAMVQSHKDLIMEAQNHHTDKLEFKETIKLQDSVIRDLERDVKNLSHKNDLYKEENASLVSKDFVSLTRKILSEQRGLLKNGILLKRLDHLWRQQD